MARICSDEMVVGDLDEGSFCAMACPDTRLNGFIELMVVVFILLKQSLYMARWQGILGSSQTPGDEENPDSLPQR